ncbi:hypothetical protein FRX31_033028 [Thalictrum thalictroides]|uniref:Uncharacterized protein n=1 Tax=Thalictrum thalictroides TaxID=46969 RepID=A0A7J6UXN8_THATH|nr:hypothetical protein FRX31_033028 [Thalictrum thalictroides]
MTTVLQHCLQCLEWELSQEQARQKAEDEIEHERMQIPMIDWRSKVSAMEEDLPDIFETGKEADMEKDEEVRRGTDIFKTGK